ncbi:hypothetical protein WG66_003993 [Moniliophthora roreri]|nr:hypothetical protein WG66_003993 [Moniliophthora roreri]
MSMTTFSLAMLSECLWEVGFQGRMDRPYNGLALKLSATLGTAQPAHGAKLRQLWDLKLFGSSRSSQSEGCDRFIWTPFRQLVANIKSTELKVPKRVRQALFMALTVSPLVLLVNISLIGNDIKRERMVEAWVSIGNVKPDLLIQVERALWEELFEMCLKGKFAEHAVESFLNRTNTLVLRNLNPQTKLFFHQAFFPTSRRHESDTESDNEEASATTSRASELPQRHRSAAPPAMPRPSSSLVESRVILPLSISHPGDSRASPSPSHPETIHLLGGLGPHSAPDRSESPRAPSPDTEALPSPSRELPLSDLASSAGPLTPLLLTPTPIDIETTPSSCLSHHEFHAGLPRTQTTTFAENEPLMRHLGPSNKALDPLPNGSSSSTCHASTIHKVRKPRGHASGLWYTKRFNRSNGFSKLGQRTSGASGIKLKVMNNNLNNTANRASFGQNSEDSTRRTALPMISCERVSKRSYTLYTPDGRCVLYRPAFYSSNNEFRQHEKFHRLLTSANRVLIGSGYPAVGTEVSPDAVGAASSTPTSILRPELIDSVPGVHYMSYTHFTSMNGQSLRNVFRQKHLVVTAVPFGSQVRTAFDKDLFDKFVSELRLYDKLRMNGERVTKLCDGPGSHITVDFSSPNDSGTDHDTARVIQVSLAEMIAQAQAGDTGKIISCARLPAPAVEGATFPTRALQALMTEQEGWLDTHMAPGECLLATTQCECRRTNELARLQAALKDAVDFSHAHFTGFATTLGVENGAILVFLPVSRNTDFDVFARTGLHRSIESLVEHGVDAHVIAILLLPGDTLIMRPGTFYHIVNVQHSICATTSFISAVTIRDTCWSLFHEFFQGHPVDQLPDTSHRLMLVEIMVHWHKTILSRTHTYLRLCVEGDPTVAHVPNLLTFTGLMDFLTLFNILELSSVLWPDSYPHRHVASAEGSPDCHRVQHHEQAYCTGRRLAREIVNWFRQNLLIVYRPPLLEGWRTLYRDSIDPSKRIDHIIRSYLLQQCTALLSQLYAHTSKRVEPALVRERIVLNLTTRNDVPLFATQQLENHLDSYLSYEPPSIRLWSDVDGYNWEPEQSTTYAWVFEYRGTHLVKPSHGLPHVPYGVQDLVHLDNIFVKAVRYQKETVNAKRSIHHDHLTDGAALHVSKKPRLSS